VIGFGAPASTLNSQHSGAVREGGGALKRRRRRRRRRIERHLRVSFRRVSSAIQGHRDLGKQQQGSEEASLWCPQGLLVPDWNRRPRPIRGMLKFAPAGLSFASCRNCFQGAVRHRIAAAQKLTPRCGWRGVDFYHGGWRRRRPGRRRARRRRL
jgi:hypothetical protein